MTRIYKLIARTFYLFIFILVLVSCEVVVKETKIDPFSYLLEKQDLLFDRIDSVLERLQYLEEDRLAEVNTLRINGWQVEEKLDQIYSGVSNLEEKIEKMAIEISTFKSLQVDKVKSDCSYSHLADVGNYLFPVPKNERHSKESETRSEKETLPENDMVTENEATKEEIMSMPAVQDIKLPKIKGRDWSQNDSANVESMVQYVGLTLNNNLEYAINKLKDIILQTSHTANFRQDNQLLLDKSRVNVSRALLKMIATNQQLIENKIEITVTEELESVKGALFSEVAEIKKVLHVFKLLFNETSQVNESAVNENAAVNDTLDDYLLTTDDNDFLVQLNALHDTNSSNFATSPSTDALNNQTDTVNETLTAPTIRSVMQLLTDMKTILPVDDHDINEESNINNQLTVSRTEAQLNQTESLRNENETEKPITLHSLLRLSNISNSVLLQKVDDLQTSLTDRIKKAEEQIIGFKIYQSSALHSHMKEVRFELLKMREEMSSSMAATSNKLSKKLESNKLSLFGYMNAAVTSITSSAVTSSKATGVAISKTLRSIFQQLQTKMLEISWFGSVRCPGLYQKVGSSCLLVVESLQASWIDTCKFCSDLGGVIPKINKKDLSILKQILNNETDGMWLRTENSSTQSDTCKEDNSLIVSTDNLKISERICTAFLANGTTVDDVPCSKELPVVCQRENVVPAAISKDFNISTALSDLDFFLSNSKYYKFKKSYF